MSNYRDRYIARGIPEFDPDACAPYPIGQVPQSGWFLIEPAGTYTVPVPDTSIPPAKRWDVDEVIDKAALHIVNGQRGVYVKYGNLQRFLKITTLYENDSYILVPEDGKLGSANEVRLYDEIIVQGTNLEDGKLL